MMLVFTLASITVWLLVVLVGFRNRWVAAEEHSVETSSAEAQASVRRAAPPVLQVAELAKTYRDGDRERLVLDELWHTTWSGMTGLVGTSGAGKSTLGRIIAGLELPDRGEVLLGGRPLRFHDERDLRVHRTRVTYIAQEHNLIGCLSVLDNAALGLLGQGVDTGVARRRAKESLARVGLQGYESRLPATLSGGESQRVAVARALAAHAELIVADEPTGSLDGENADAVLRLLAGLAAEDGRAVILITHDRERAARWCDKIVELQAGLLKKVPLREQGALTPAPRGTRAGGVRSLADHRKHWPMGDLHHA